MRTYYLILAGLSLSASSHADAPPPSYRAVVFGSGAGEAERLAHCDCVTTAGRPDLCVPASAWAPIVTDSSCVYASGCEYVSPSASLALIFYSCGSPGHTAYMLNDAGPTAHEILASGTCDPNGVVRDAIAGVACSYVNGEISGSMPPRGAFASTPHTQRAICGS